MSITRLAWLSDTHLGYRQYGLARRLADFEQALKHAVEDIADRGITTILHTGDLLHSNRPGSDTMVGLKQLNDWMVRKGIAMLVIPGNHDRALDSSHWIHVVNHPETITLGRAGIHLLDRQLVQVGGLSIYGVGNMSREEFVQHKFPVCDIIMAHQAVVEFIKFKAASALTMAELPLDKARAVLLGDIHVTDLRTVGNNRVLVGYPGSTEMNSESESDKKFWFELQVPQSVGEIKLEGHPIRTRPVIRAEVRTVADVGRLASEAKTTTGGAAMVFVDYDASVPELQSALLRELNPDEYVLRLNPILSTMTSSSPVAMAAEGAPKSVQEILRELVVDDPELHAVAHAMVDPGDGAAPALNAFVDDQLRKIAEGEHAEPARA